MKQSWQRVSALLAVALAAGTITAFEATPASAATLQSCAKVTGTATFSPGLSNTPANNTVSAKGTETGCTPSAATGGSGTINATIKVTAGSCAKLATGKQKLIGTAVTKWKNGKVSNYSLTFTTGTGSTATTASITGKVTSGLFAGHKISAVVKFTVTGTPNCTSKPVKTVTFKNTKPFMVV